MVACISRWYYPSYDPNSTQSTTMARTLLTYRVSVVNAKEHIQLTTQQRSGADAAAYALRIYPWASAVSTKPINTQRA